MAERDDGTDFEIGERDEVIPAPFPLMYDSHREKSNTCPGKVDKHSLTSHP